MENQTMESERDRPLIHRVLFGGNNTEPTKIVQSDTIQTQEIVNTPLATKVLEGGAKKLGGSGSDMVAKSIYFRKINTLFVVLVIAILFALMLMKMKWLMHLFFKEEDPDNNFEEEEPDLKKRWKRIMRYTIIFILMIIISHVLIVLILFLIMLLFKYFRNDFHFQPAKEFAAEKIKEMFWEYKDDTGADAGLISYYMLLFLALIVMFVFYMIYTLLVKSYFSNIYFEKIYNEKNPEIEDLQQPQKYLYQYSIYILIMMLFVLLLLNYDKLRQHKVVFVYNIVFVMVYVIVTLNLLRLHLTKQRWKFILFFLVFILLFTLYKLPLKALAKYLG
jgi:hypothetical protein